MACGEGGKDAHRRPTTMLAMDARRPAALLAGLTAVHFAPYLASVVAYSPHRFSAVRRRFPRTFGVGRRGHLALTFDDGPHPEGTPVVLDALAEAGRSATFFMVAEEVRRHPTVARSVVEGGHEVALHGLHHRSFLGSALPSAHRQLGEAVDLLVDVCGVRPRYFRPPFGSMSASAVAAARAHGLQTVLWTAWGKDWAADATVDRCMELLAEGQLDGGTVLLHDGTSPTSPGNWQAAAGTVRALAAWSGESGIEIGTLGEHGA